MPQVVLKSLLNISVLHLGTYCVSNNSLASHLKLAKRYVNRGQDHYQSLVHSNLQSSMNTRDDSNGTFPCCQC